MPNSARLVTADELERLPEDDWRYELVRGRLIRMSPAAPRHGKVTVMLASLLLQHVTASRLGEVWTEVGFRLFDDPDTVRAPDVAFVSTGRLPAPDSRGFYRGAPDVAFEVLSPGDSPSEIRDRVGDYLAAATPVVVVIDPTMRRVTVHRPGERDQSWEIGDTINLEAAISGLRIPVAALFE